jgi:uncharacterized membrane protein YfcA
MDASSAAVVVVVSLLASAAQGLTGFGYALVVVPFFILILDVQDAVVVATVLGAVGVALIVVRVYRDVPWPTVGRLLAGSAAGIPAGLTALVFAPEDVLRIAVGLAAAAMALLLAAGVRVETRSAPADLAAGAVSGALRASTGLPGPPVVLYLQGSGTPPHEFRATLAVVFFAGGLISLVALAAAGVVHGDALALAAIGVPAVVVGNWTGGRLHGRIDPELFGRLVLALLVATSLAAVGTSLARLAG